MGVTLAVSTFPLKKSSFLRFSLMSFSQFSAALYRLSSPMMGTPSASTSCTLSLLFSDGFQVCRQISLCFGHIFQIVIIDKGCVVEQFVFLPVVFSYCVRRVFAWSVY